MLARLIRVHFKTMYNNKIDIGIYSNLLFIFLYILSLRNLTKFKTYKPVQFILNFRIIYLMPDDGQYDRTIYIYIYIHTHTHTHEYTGVLISP
jgi:hypothetical protein